METVTLQSQSDLLAEIENAISTMRKYGYEIRTICELQDLLVNDVDRNDVFWPVDRNEFKRCLAFIDNLSATFADMQLCTNKAIILGTMIGQPVYRLASMKKEIHDCGCLGPYQLEAVETSKVTCVCERGQTHKIDIREITTGPVE